MVLVNGVCAAAPNTWVGGISLFTHASEFCIMRRVHGTQPEPERASMSETEVMPKTEQELKAEYAIAIEAAMNNPVITKITRFVPSNEGTEFDQDAFERQTRIFAPEMREVMQTMFEK